MVRKRDALFVLVSAAFVCFLVLLGERNLASELLGTAPWFGFHDHLRIPMFHYLFIFTENIGWAIVLIIPLVALIPRVRKAGVRCAEWAAANPRTLAASVFVVLCAGSWFAYHHHPLAQDEYAPVCQATAFSAGHVMWNYPPELLNRYLPKRHWDYFFAVDSKTGNVASLYLPGFALLLTPFAWLGIPWACNPAIGALTLLVLHALAGRITAGNTTGGWAVLFALASPAFAVNAISFYSMPAHLLANLVFLWLIVQPTPKRLIGAGLVGAFALVLHNPVPHILFALPCWSWLLWRKGGWRNASWLLAGYLPLGLLLGIGWPCLLDQLRATGEQVHRSATPDAHLGGINLWLTKLQQIVQWPNTWTAWRKLLELTKLWLWAVPGLPWLAVLGYRRIRCRERSPIPLLLAGSAIATFAGYALIGLDQEHGWGYRYFHSAWGFLPLMAAALVAAPENGESRISSGWHWRSLCGGLIVGSLLIAIPARMLQTEAFVRWNLEHALPAPAEGRYVVFIGTKLFAYSVDLVQNLPGENRVIRFETWSDVEDTATMSRFFPGSTLVRSDARGSLWRIRE